jgi:hypothetical protein
VQLDAVEAVVEVEEVAVDLPTFTLVVAGDDEEAVRLGVEARKPGEGGQRLFKRCREKGVEDGRAAFLGAKWLEWLVAEVQWRAFM